MRLKSIKIENYKSLKNVEINDLGNLVAFIGPNMAGKSNIFDALWLLHEGMEESLKNAIETRRGNYADLVWRKNIDEKIRIILCFELEEDFRNELLIPFFSSSKEFFHSRIYKSDFFKKVNYELNFSLNEPTSYFDEKLLTINVDEAKSDLVIIWKFLNLSNHSCESRISSFEPQFGKILKIDGNKFGKNLRDLSSQSWDINALKLAFYKECYSGLKELEGKVISRFIQFIKNMKWLSPNKNINNVVAISEEKALRFDASNLANVIHILNSNFPSKFNMLLPHLKFIVPEVNRLSTPVIGNGTTVGLEELNQASIVYKLSNFSAGIKNIITIITLLLTAKEDDLILIEEPEIHLHPSALRRLVEIMQKYATNKQIFITTHSPTVLLNFSIDNIRLVKRDKDGNTKVENVDSESSMEIIDQLGIQPSDLLDYDVIIFVEGPFDEDIFKAFAGKSNVDTNGICFISTEGWSNIEYYVNARVLQRRRVCPNIIGVFDGDLEKRPKAKREKDNMLRRMRVPKDNIFNLQLGEIECYLLDAEAWFRAWSSLKEKVSEEELKNEFEKIKQSEKQKECMEKLMKRLGLESYTGKIAIKIVNNMSFVPDEIEGILKHAKNLIGENSK